MEHTRGTLHQTSALYPTKDAALEARASLLECGVEPREVRLVLPHDPEFKRKLGADVREAERRVVLSILTGAVVGALGGATFGWLGSTLVSAPVPISGASAVVMLALAGALAGVFLAGLGGMRAHAPDSRALVAEAAHRGHCAVVVATRRRSRLRRARAILSAKMAATQSGDLQALARRLARASEPALMQSWDLDRGR